MAQNKPRVRFSSQAALAMAAWLSIASYGASAENPDSATGFADKSHTGLHEETFFGEAWISDIGTLLYADLDEDGYFSGLSLSIDADTKYSSYEVYVVIELIEADATTDSTLGETPIAERLHTTRVFDLYGRSASDEYRIDIDLVQNYSPGTYNLLIGLIDAHDDRILDLVGADDFRNLRALSLESKDNLAIHTPVVERPTVAPNDDIRVAEYAGSTGLGMITCFAILLVLRRLNKTPYARQEFEKVR